MDPIACIGAACLLSLKLTGGDFLYNHKLPHTAKSYDGVSRDISKFYKEERTPINFQGYAVLNTNTKINFGFDNGIQTPKYTKDRTFVVGVNQYIKLNDDWKVNLTSNVKWGGHQKHEPCVDSYKREYYCATLTAWSDFKEPERNETSYNVGIRFSRKFSF